MAEPVDLEEKRVAEQRLALLALTGAQPAPSGSCLDAEELSALVEGKLTPAQAEPCLAHLAGCEHCYATWRLLDEDWQLRTRDTGRNRLRQLLGRPRFLATAGSFLAAAASIAVFLNSTMQADRRTLLRPPAPTSQEQIRTAPASEAADQAQPEKESPAPAATAPADVEPEGATGDKMREEKERSERILGRASDSAPAAPQVNIRSTTKTAASRPAPLAGTAPLTLAVWHTSIRTGCQGEPGPAFFDEISEQGQQLLQQSASLQKSERRRIERTLAMLADRQPADRQCRALLDLLGPVASSNKP